MIRRFGLMLVAPLALTIASTAFSAPPVAASAPSTELAVRSKEVIDRAVRALVAREGGDRITKLWVFPTGQANTVFVHYRTTVEHLVMLELEGERIAKLHDLTTAPESLVAAVSAGKGG
jgi:hypothetical protein